jgi:hypothetical protein
LKKKKNQSNVESGHCACIVSNFWLLQIQQVETATPNQDNCKKETINKGENNLQKGEKRPKCADDQKAGENGGDPKQQPNTS